MDHRFKKFLALAQTGSFTAAAKQLRVSQPAITLAIASLERAFGAKLYIRKSQPIKLTVKGEIVAEASKKILLEVEKMKLRLDKESTESQYQIGIIDSIAQLLYTSSKESTFLSNFDVMVDNSRRIINELLADKLDIGLITGQPKTLSKDILVHKLHSEEFVFVCAPQNDPKKVVTKIDDWLAFNKDSTSYKHFTKLFKKQGLRVRPVFYSTSMQILQEMAVAGKGTALLPLHIISSNVKNGSLIIIKTKPLYRPIWAITRKEKPTQQLNKLANQLDDLLVKG